MSVIFKYIGFALMFVKKSICVHFDISFLSDSKTTPFAVIFIRLTKRRRSTI